MVYKVGFKGISVLYLAPVYKVGLRVYLMVYNVGFKGISVLYLLLPQLSCSCLGV
jgi:hypothetical protein